MITTYYELRGDINGSDVLVRGFALPVDQATVEAIKADDSFYASHIRGYYTVTSTYSNAQGRDLLVRRPWTPLS